MAAFPGLVVVSLLLLLLRVATAFVVGVQSETESASSPQQSLSAARHHLLHDLHHDHLHHLHHLDHLHLHHLHGRAVRAAPARRAPSDGAGDHDAAAAGAAAAAVSGGERSHDDYAEDLRGSTFNQSFSDDDGRQVTLAWVGTKSGVVLALTTRDFSLPLFQMLFERTKLYRSTDYGKTYTDITEQIKFGMIRNDFAIISHPLNPQRIVLLTEKVMQNMRFFMVTSKDGGLNFETKLLPFTPVTKFFFHPLNPDVLVSISNNHSLYITKDFGDTWRIIQNQVITCKWAEDGSLYLTTTGNTSLSNRQWLDLKKSTDNGDTFSTVARGIQEFGVAGHFMYSSVLYKNAKLALHISIDGGTNWNIAQLAPSNVSRVYALLWYDEDMLFMHVDEPGVRTIGRIYTSDSRGIIFSESLDRHFFSMFNTDFTPVVSMKGVYITTRLAEDNTAQSRITFNRGGKWQPLSKPKNVDCKPDVSAEACALHIHGKYTLLQAVSVPQLLLSEQDAVGLVIAHGSVGASLDTTEQDVYVSEDGGYTWTRVLQGPHYYSILDSGGLIVAVPYSNSHIPGIIHFSMDMGQTWRKFLFSPESLTVKGLVSEPGAKSTHVSVWGHHLKISTETHIDLIWVSYTIDFSSLFKRNCTDEDTVVWVTHGPEEPANESRSCVLGIRREFTMLKSNSTCLKGPDYYPTEMLSYCQCTEEDYMCDFGYHKVSGKCVEESQVNKTSLYVCLTGEEELIETDGYRKVPGNKCRGGLIHNSTRKATSILCSHTLINPKDDLVTTASRPRPAATTAQSPLQPSARQEPPPGSSNNHGGVIAVVVLLVLVLVVGLAVVAKRSQAFRDRCNSIRYLILREEQVSL